MIFSDRTIREAIASGRIRLDPYDPSLVQRAKDEGVDVVTWTVNEPAEATRLRRAGVTGFTTDHVDRLLAWAGQESE